MPLGSNEIKSRAVTVGREWEHTEEEEANSKISELIERFSFQFESYKKSDYNKTDTYNEQPSGMIYYHKKKLHKKIFGCHCQH